MTTEAQTIRVGQYELSAWENGIYFIQHIGGEGTEVPAEAIEGALAKLFKLFF